MNILIITNDMVIPNKGGGAPRCVAVAKSFLDQGHRVILLAPFENENDPSLLGITLYKMRYVNRNDKKKIIKYGLYNPLLFLRILSIVKMHDIDIIFAHNAICGFPSLLVSKVTKAKTVLDITDFVGEFIDNTLTKYNPLKFVKKIEAYTIKKAHKVFTNTLTIQKYLEEKYDRKVYMVYDGYDKNIFYPKEGKTDKFIILNQGGMDPQDGLNILLPAVKMLIKDIPNLQVNLIGDGKVVPKLKEDIDIQGLGNHFFFSGWVSQAEVNDYMNQANIGLVILPNLFSGETRLTLRTFEYFACKLPVVAADLKAVREVVVDKHNGLLYKADDPESLAKAILFLYRNPNESFLIADNGLRTANDFEWMNLAKQITRGVLDE